jgi:hypothetical protein
MRIALRRQVIDLLFIYLSIYHISNVQNTLHNMHKEFKMRILKCHIGLNGHYILCTDQFFATSPL